MSYQVLARRWRPQKFEDVVGQSHITKSIQNSLKEDRVGHAYILSGTRGIGKTSVARIFAKALRCESLSSDGNPCGACGSCENFNTNSSMDVIEIDGASNNSVDDIRDLIGNIQYLPTTGKYKVYIIDEVHMLSTNAFNALLKTLEEPPEHAKFILATTEPEKLLGTVLSRCQRFDFRNASVADLESHVKMICDKEGISFSEDYLVTELAKLGNGSFRDTLSLLDQILSFSLDKKIDEELFARSLGVAKTSAVRDLIHSVIDEDLESLTSNFRQMISENVSVKNISLSLLESIFAVITAKDFNNIALAKNRIDEDHFAKISRAELYWLYELLSTDLTWALSSLSPDDSVELVIRKAAVRNQLISEVQGGASHSEGKPEAQTAPPQEVVVPTSEQPQEIQAEQLQEPPSHVTEEIPQEEVREIKIPLDVKPDPVEETVEEEVVLEEKTPEPIVIEGEKTWEGFLAHLTSLSPASASNLEQGNMLSPLNYNDNSLTISLGFPMSAKVFFDYLNEQESYEKLKDHLSLYFSVDKEEVNLSLELVEKEKAQETQFKSKFEEKVEAEDIERKEKLEKINTDPLIEHAKNIFKSDIDKIRLNED